MNAFAQHPAVKDGTVSEVAAFAGMNEAQLARLAEAHPFTQVLVRMNCERFVCAAVHAARRIARLEADRGDYCRDVTLVSGSHLITP